MKKIIIALAISSLFIACGSEKEETVENQEDKVLEDDSQEKPIDFSELREFPMSDYDLEAVLFIPQKHYIDGDENDQLEEPLIDHAEGEAFWDLSMRSDKNWKITVEDWADVEKSIALEKEIHKETAEVYDYNYIEEGEDYLLYQRALTTGGTTMDEKTASKLPNFHFVVVKKINGTYITIKSNDLGEFRKISVEKMMNAARAMK